MVKKSKQLHLVRVLTAGAHQRKYSEDAGGMRTHIKDITFSPKNIEASEEEANDMAFGPIGELVKIIIISSLRI